MADDMENGPKESPGPVDSMTEKRRGDQKEQNNKSGDQSDNRPSNTRRKPNRMNKKQVPPTGLEYKEMGPVCRSMHWDYYLKCANDQSFKSYKLDDSYRTLLPKVEGFLWFRALRLDRTTLDNDWFGNVRCSFDLIDLLSDDPDINMFYVDTSYFGYSSASRILLTKEKEMKSYKKLELNSLKYGDPILFVDGKVFSLETDVSRKKDWWGKHTTEFVVDTNSISPNQLFKMCRKEAVNHSHANTTYRSGRFRPHQCFIYNSSLRKQCPFPWTEIKIQEELMTYKNEGGNYKIPVEVPTYEKRTRSNFRRFRTYGRRTYARKSKYSKEADPIINQED